MHLLIPVALSQGILILTLLTEGLPRTTSLPGFAIPTKLLFFKAFVVVPYTTNNVPFVFLFFFF